METMKTFTLGDEIYEITDEYARYNIEKLKYNVGKINNSTTGSVGQVITIESIDAEGKPATYKGSYKGYIGCARGSKESIPLTGNGEFDTIPLTTWIAKNDIMSFSGGGIKCAVSGVVKIWGSVELNTVYNDERAGVYIFKNDEELVGCYGLGNLSSNVQIVTSVSAGDIIYLKARNSTERTDRLAFPKSKSTNLCVEYC